jgi:hypothetical protein
MAETIEAGQEFWSDTHAKPQGRLQAFPTDRAIQLTINVD